MRWSRSPSGNTFPRLPRRPGYGPLSRRLVLLGAMAAGVALVPLRSEAAPLRRISVSVDLHGVAAIAAHIRGSLPRHLARELAQNPIDGYPPGARLHVRVTEVFLSNDGGPTGGRFGGFAMPDALEGEVTVLDGAGGVLLRKRASGRSQPSGGVAAAPYNEPRRIEELVRAFAYWVVRELP